MYPLFRSRIVVQQYLFAMFVTYRQRLRVSEPQM